MPHKRGITFLKWIEESFVLYFHWVLALAPIAAIGLGVFFGSAAHVAEALFAIGAIAVNFLLLGLRSWLEENRELTLFHTFWSGTILPPSHPAKELLFNTEVAIIEAHGHSYFAEAVHQKFQMKTKADSQAQREPDQDQRLRLTPVICVSAADQLTEEQKKAAISDQDQLANAISKSEAVVVVRTEALDKKPWVIDTLHAWAKNDVEAPMLIVRPQARVKYEPHELMDKFWWIRDNPKSLPWHLVKRARDRAVGWRAQATYNRAMAINFLFLSIMLLILGVIVVERQREERFAEGERHTVALGDERVKAANDEEGMREALDTLQRYQKEVIGSADDKLSVSYWIRKDGAPFVSVTTEKESTQDNFKNDKSSIIGCGFFEPSKIVGWIDGGNTRVFDFSNREIKGSGCTMHPRDETIKAIICSAYQPSDSESHEATVGICVFSANKNEFILGTRSQDLLRERTIKFSKDFRSRIESRQVTTLNERRKLRKPNQQVR